MHEIATKLKENNFGEEITDVVTYRGDLTLVVRPHRIKEIIFFLKTDPSLRFNMMLDLFGMDYLKCNPPKPSRFAVIYILYSMEHHRHLCVKTFLPEEKPEIDSIADIYRAANWNEREAWDLFGIVFKGHPNLVRLLCHTEFVGHALRKDYPADQYQRLKTASPSAGI